MKILLLQDVYNLGRAGEVKKVANGYGRNYLLPQGLAVLATKNALLQSDRIREEANRQRAILNQEFAAIADQLTAVELQFPARAGETGKLYGSITTAQVAEALTEKTGIAVEKRQIESEPLRQLGLHTVRIHLTIDLIPEVDVIVYREGENPENYKYTTAQLAGDEPMPGDLTVISGEVMDAEELGYEEVEEIEEEVIDETEETEEEVEEE